MKSTCRYSAKRRKPLESFNLKDQTEREPGASIQSPLTASGNCARAIKPITVPWEVRPIGPDYKVPHDAEEEEEAEEASFLAQTVKHESS